MWKWWLAIAEIIDAAYLVLPNAKSRVAGYYYLSNRQPPFPHIPDPPLNGAIWIEWCTLPLTVTAAAEAETGGLFLNGRICELC